MTTAIQQMGPVLFALALLHKFAMHLFKVLACRYPLSTRSGRLT